MTPSKADCLQWLDTDIARRIIHGTDPYAEMLIAIRTMLAEAVPNESLDYDGCWKCNKRTPPDDPYSVAFVTNTRDYKNGVYVGGYKESHEGCHHIDGRTNHVPNKSPDEYDEPDGSRTDY